MIVFGEAKRRLFSTVAFSHDARHVAAGGDGQNTVLRETATGREIASLKQTVTSLGQCLLFHPRAPWLYLPTRTGLIAFDTTTGNTRELWLPGGFVRSVALEPSVTRLIGVGYKRPTNSNPLLQVQCASSLQIQIRSDQISLPPATDPLDLFRVFCISVADPDNPVTLWERRDVGTPNEAWSQSVAFYPHGERFVMTQTALFAGSDGPRIAIRDSTTGEAIHTLRGKGTDAKLLAISPSGEWLVTGRTQSLFVFDLKNLTAQPREFKNDSRSHFTGIAFHPSGRYLAAASNDATIKLYDTADWKVAKTYTWDIGRMRSIAFSLDGTLAAAGSDSGRIVVWDVDG